MAERNLLLEVNSILFAGDSGDGMQLVGHLFARQVASLGYDVRTYPDYPAEIRAPAGTVAGVSGFQITYSEQKIHTVADGVDVMIAMGAAAVKCHIEKLSHGGTLVLNRNQLTLRDWQKAGYADDQLTELAARYQVFTAPMTDLVVQLAKSQGISHSQAKRCKNLFALGLCTALCEVDTACIAQLIAKKFVKKPELLQVNQAALQAGVNFADTCEFVICKQQKAFITATETQQYITGNEGFALACAALARHWPHRLLLSGYPITPASTLLQRAAELGDHGVVMFQAEDEIAAIGVALGAAYGGSLALTCTSGPGLDLKTETLGLACMVELPLVIINIQRAGPSTGMPTKPEQSDLAAVLCGRHGETPIPVLAAASPSDCYSVLVDAMRIATAAMTPVIVLSDAYIAHASEPWQGPDPDCLTDFAKLAPKSVKADELHARDPNTLSKPWIIPGQPDLMHRIGGLEKNQATGHICYEADNHQRMCELRACKIDGIKKNYQALKIEGDASANVLVITWGCVYGKALSALLALQRENLAIALVNLRYLFPLPEQLSELMQRHKTIIVPEMNSGHLAKELRAHFLRDVISVPNLTGQPFKIADLYQVFKQQITHGSISDE